MNFIWTGFNDTILDFSRESFHKIYELKSLDIISKYFDVAKQKLAKEYDDFYTTASYFQAIENFERLMINNAYEPKELKALMEYY